MIKLFLFSADTSLKCIVFTWSNLIFIVTKYAIAGSAFPMVKADEGNTTIILLYWLYYHTISCKFPSH